ncbi:hypothetical protein LMH87_000258 [Akanthomyces muscarius]|uniref:Amidase domain-containing protein n=1 Tax=Akanthomyces muscarius TaxID=2231603 RepID=A0A9W8QGZ0_AKAMU|nr:hypothetical protein LMH87_000258 [Akanthomyces muscarius]KAJ4154988.1 hypothetical protein LMH87_000258 [Akanthomyces muscarius]
MVNLPLASYHLGASVEVAFRYDSRPQDAVANQPVLLLSLHRESTAVDVAHKIAAFYDNDDVFSEDFLTDTVIVQVDQPEEAPAIQWADVHRLVGRGGSWHPVHILQVEDTQLPQGPYFLSPGNLLFQAWRLYPDTQDAFVSTFVPAGDDALHFKPLNITAADNLWRAVAVPSRLYAIATSEKPLAGKRISVKDNFKVAGIKTTQGNRAFSELYGPESETATYIQTLISLGAIIVGKTKLCAFASSEEATDQWIDYHAPFNPRADGYQTPSGSTTGGATSLASYEWLDFSLGTDTTGSTRWPAAWNGLFGIRITSGADTLDGVYPSCRSMDTIGLLSRDIHQLSSLVKHSFPALADGHKHPTRILYSTDFFPHLNPAQQEMVEKFTFVLEDFLGIKRTLLNIEERWNACPPVEAGGQSIRDYISKTAYYPFYYDGFQEYSEFRQEYEQKFGKPAYVGPYMRWKWDRGAEVSLEQKEQALKEMEVYRRWFRENIMASGTDGYSDAVLILPCGSGEPKYRDLPNSAPAVVPSFSPNYIASMLGLPQIVIPIGQLKFESRISKRSEYLPVVASMAGAPGCDKMLLSLARDVLDASNRPTAVQTGRFTFKL